MRRNVAQVAVAAAVAVVRRVAVDVVGAVDAAVEAAVDAVVRYAVADVVDVADAAAVAVVDAAPMVEMALLSRRVLLRGEGKQGKNEAYGKNFRCPEGSPPQLSFGFVPKTSVDPLSSHPSVVASVVSTSFTWAQSGLSK